MRMKRLAFSLSYLIIFLGTFNQSFAQKKYEKTKTISKKYDARTNKPLVIQNKYGTVHINTTEGTEIKVDITMKAWGSSEQKASETLKSISVRVDEGNALNPLSPINFETKLPVSGKQKANFQVDYQISMPKKNDLKLSNRYGHTYLGDHSGELWIDVKYGSLKTEQVTGAKEKKITVAYGSADIYYVEQGNLTMKYSGLKLDKAQNITLKSSYSKAEVNQVENLNLDCSYGEIELDVASAIKGKVSFSDFELGALNKKIALELSYNNDFTIGQIKKNFESINIDGDYSDCDLKFEQGSKCQFEVALKYSDLRLDKTKATLKVEEQGSNFKKYSGTYGGSGAKSKIKINSRYGNVSFK